MSSPFEVIEVGGIPFAATNLERATDWVVNDRREGAGTGVSVRLSNSYCVSAAHSDRDYSAVLKGPGVNFADGTPVNWVMRLIGCTASDHVGVRPVRGPSFFEATLDKGRRDSLRHHFVGTTEETLSLLTDRVEEFTRESRRPAHMPRRLPRSARSSSTTSSRRSIRRHRTSCGSVWVRRSRTLSRRR